MVFRASLFTEPGTSYNRADSPKYCDPEVKGVIVCTSIKTENSVLQPLEKFSDWSKVVIAIAVIKRCIDHGNEPINELHRKRATFTVLRMIQEDSFKDEIKRLRAGKILPKGSLQTLDPFIDENGLVRVGGRLRRASMSYEVKHPIILPRKGHLVELIIKHCHQQLELYNVIRDQTLLGPNMN